MVTRNHINYYQLLGVTSVATTSEVVAAFRKLARRFHPNVNPGDPAAERRYEEISEAFEILSDARKRAFFDQHGYYDEEADMEQLAAGAEAAAGKKSPAELVFEGFDFGEINRSFGDVLDQILAGGAPEGGQAKAPEHGADIEHPLAVTFEEAFRGREVTLTLSRMRACEACDATGFTRAPSITCVTCEGTGKRLMVRGGMRLSSTCEDCRGHGRRVPVCPVCAGPSSGARTWSAGTLSINLPPGVDSGSKIRIAGEGHVGPFGSAPGDLYVVTQVGAHPFFTRKGENLYCAMPITLTEAVLGTHVEIPTLEGPATLRVPPGSQPGQVFRLRAKGFSSLRGDARGDLYVEIKVVVPRVADPRSRELIEEFARLNPDNPRTSLPRLKTTAE